MNFLRLFTHYWFWISFISTKICYCRGSDTTNIDEAWNYFLLLLHYWFTIAKNVSNKIPSKCFGHCYTLNSFLENHKIWFHSHVKYIEAMWPTLIFPHNFQYEPTSSKSLQQFWRWKLWKPGRRAFCLLSLYARIALWMDPREVEGLPISPCLANYATTVFNFLIRTSDIYT
jgi:hypothetical protein